MTGSNRVRWEDVDRDTYEDMVAVLISRLHPTCTTDRRLWGRWRPRCANATWKEGSRYFS